MRIRGGKGPGGTESRDERGEAGGTLDSRLSTLDSRLVARFARRPERRIVVRLLRHLRHVLDMRQRAIRSDDEDGAGLQTEWTDERPVRLAEGGVPMVGSGLNMVGALLTAETRLRERQIH